MTTLDELLVQGLRTHAFDDCGGRDIPTHIANQAADALEAAARENERLAKENASLRHWSVGHIDALLLYAAGTYPNDSHVKDAVAFCRLVAPGRKLRMDRLEASSFHPAAYALSGGPHE